MAAKKTIKLLGIPGSLREKSFNRMLLNALAELVGEDCELDFGTIQGIPLYNQDDEDHKGIPQAVIDLQNQIVASDGLVLVTPEYNGSLPGVLKNAIDYLSRPPKDIERVFRDLPIAILGATPGGKGTISCQAAWLTVFHQLKTRPYSGGSVYVSKAKEVFNEEGKLVDPKMKKQLQDFVDGFKRFASENTRLK